MKKLPKFGGLLQPPRFTLCSLMLVPYELIHS